MTEHITVSRELLRQVLGALQSHSHPRFLPDDLAESITALRTALEQPAVEPVAYLYHDARTPKDAHPWFHSTMLVLAADRRLGLRGETPLYTSPQAQQPLCPCKDRPADQCPGEWELGCDLGNNEVHCKPAQQPQMLTDKEILMAAPKVCDPSSFAEVKVKFARAIESAVLKKNGVAK